MKRTLMLAATILSTVAVLIPGAGAAPATQLQLVGVATAITVGQKDFVNVEARDAGGVRDTAYAGTATFSADCGACFTVTPASYTFQPADQGVTTVTVTWTKAGTYALTVTGTLASGGSQSSTTSGIVVAPTAATQVRLAGVDTAMTAGVQDSFNVEARNPQDDTDTNYAGTVTFTASCGDTCFTVTPAKQYPFVPGDAGVKVFKVTWNQSGTQSLTVTGTLAGGGTDTDTVTGIAVTAGGTTTTSTTSTTSTSITPSTSTSTTSTTSTSTTSTTVPHSEPAPAPAPCSPPSGPVSGMVWRLSLQWDSITAGALARVAQLVCALGL